MAIALLLFAGITVFIFRGVLRAGPGSHVPFLATEEFVHAAGADVLYESWLLSRHARTLAERPDRLFATEHCAPEKRSLTLGIPMIAMGLLGVPAAMFTSNPAIVYDTAIALSLILAAMAMYLLVSEWTGVPAAGIAAGILYAFNDVRIGTNIVHPAEWDTTWFVFALVFAYRLLDRGSWRDAALLALACSLQIATSFYSFLGAFFFAVPFAAWLIARLGLRKTSAWQICFVVVAVTLAAALMFGPYLDMRSESETLHTAERYFARWFYFLPGNVLFVGWEVITLALVGLGARRDRAVGGIDFDPRLAVIAGALVVASIAGGPHNNDFLRAFWTAPPVTFPNLYDALASFVPGMDSIRVVFRLDTVVLAAYCILAGMGVAFLLSFAAEHRRLAASVAVSLALAGTLARNRAWEPLEVRVDGETIRFFEDLRALANTGAIFELPILRGSLQIREAPRQILAIAHHGRRTSACFGSFGTPGRRDLEAIAARLPDAAAARDLANRGFTTVIVHRDIPELKTEANRFVDAAARAAEDCAPRALHESDRMIAYTLPSPVDPACGGSSPATVPARSAPLE
ncbi:MAG: hypothetical protein ACE5FL_06210 [Myxococcota bacterium]